MNVNMRDNYINDDQCNILALYVIVTMQLVRKECVDLLSHLFKMFLKIWKIFLKGASNYVTA